MASKDHDHMASSKHQSQSLCFYNLPLFYDDNLIPEIKIQDRVYARDNVTFTHSILPLCFEINDLLISMLLNHPVSLPLWQHQKAKVCGKQHKAEE